MLRFTVRKPVAGGGTVGFCLVGEVSLRDG